MRKFGKRDELGMARLEKDLRAHRAEAPSSFVRALEHEVNPRRHAFRPRLRYALVAAIAVAMIAVGASAGLPSPPTLPTPNHGSSGHHHGPPPPPPSHDQYKTSCGSAPYVKCVSEVSPDHPTVNQPTSGTYTLGFTVTLSKPAHGTVTVTCTPGGGTATAGIDYSPASSTATIGPGSKTGSCSITIYGKATPGPDTTFNVAFTPSAGTVMDSDDNSQTVTLHAKATSCGSAPYEKCVAEVSPDHPTVNQPTSGTYTLTFAITLNKPAHGTVTVTCNPGGGTAKAGVDYSPASSTATIGPGSKTGSCSITIYGKATPGPDSTFNVAFTPSAGTVMDSDDNSQTVTLHPTAKKH